MAAEYTPGRRAMLFALACLACGSAAAQSAANPTATGPETLQMIDALKPSASRGMRNLLVRTTAPEPAAASAGDATAAPAQPVPVPVAPVAPVAAPVAAPVTAPVSVVAAEQPPSLSLPIRFEPNSARVRPESGALLGSLVAAMQSPDLKANRFVIEGHTDASGAAAANLRLSQQRADEVRLYLVALGVHPARLKALGKGSAEPANPKEPLSAQNRRVRVVTLE